MMDWKLGKMELRFDTHGKATRFGQSRCLPDIDNLPGLWYS